MSKSLSRTDNEIAEIYKRHVKTVYSVCYTYMMNRFDTEDATAETFARMIKAAVCFNDEEHEKAWLIRTASNICKDVLKHSRRRLENIEDHANNLQTNGDFEAGNTLDAISRLPIKQRMVIYLYYYEGYTSVQLSRIFRKPQSTIRNLLCAARTALRKELGDLDEE